LPGSALPGSANPHPARYSIAAIAGSPGSLSAVRCSRIGRPNHRKLCFVYNLKPVGVFCKSATPATEGISRMQDLTLLGHVAFLRYYAVELQALAYASPTIAAKLRQIAHSLEMDGDALEKIVSGEGLTEAWQEGCVAPTRDVAKPPHNAG